MADGVIRNQDVAFESADMAKRNLEAAYKFLGDRAKDRASFTVDALAAATGWAPATVRTYISKQWSTFLTPLGEGQLTVLPTFLEYPLDVFQRINSQKFLINKDPFKPILSQRTEELISKSRESALLGVQVYNNPVLAFRTPSFIVHMVIAYTSLFHAIFEENGTGYTSLGRDGSPRLTPSGQPWLWSLSECVEHYFQGETTPVRENLRMFVELRDEIEHRFAPAFDLTIAEHCQAMLVNYERLITEHFSPYYALGSAVSVPLQLSQTGSRSRADALRELQRNDFQVLSQLVERFSGALPDSIATDPEFRFRVLLVQVPANHSNSADVAMRFVRYEDLTDETRSELTAAVTLTKAQRVPVRNLGNLRAKAVVTRVQEVEPRFRQYEHTLCWKYFQVRPAKFSTEGCDERFCQPDLAFRDFVYTEAWVEKLIGVVRDPVQYAQVMAIRETRLKT